MSATAEIVSFENKSTGPRTADGKAKSRFNARRHNLTGQTIVMTAEELGAYSQLSENLQGDLAPQGEFETRLVQSIADAQWQLDRAHAIEQNLFFELTTKQLPQAEPANDAEADVDWAQGQARAFLENSKQFDLLSRYATRFQRQIVQLKTTLDKSQKSRRKLEAAERVQRMRGGTANLHGSATAANRSNPNSQFVSQEAARIDQTPTCNTPPRPNTGAKSTKKDAA